MQLELEQLKAGTRGRGGLKDYLKVVKPRETGLLVFIGLVAAFLAGSGSISPGRAVLILVSLVAASAGANGLTNYLDRGIDSRMERTRHRVLPSGRIFPAEKALYFTGTLAVIGLGLAWYLHPYVFLADAVGTTAAVIYRKRVTCVFPQGMIASCAPVLMGWFSVKPSVSWELLLLCALIGVWLPSHIWSVMMANKSDYQNAGITYFPVNRTMKSVVKILFAFCVMLYAASIGLYFVGHFGWLYLVIANLLGIAVMYAGLRMVITNASRDAWRLYKLSAFPYLGLMFLVIWLDIWLKI
jgi:protoheme IX farnesyltransferase